MKPKKSNQKAKSSKHAADTKQTKKQVKKKIETAAPVATARATGANHKRANTKTIKTAIPTSNTKDQCILGRTPVTPNKVTEAITTTQDSNSSKAKLTKTPVIKTKIRNPYIKKKPAPLSPQIPRTKPKITKPLRCLQKN